MVDKIPTLEEALSMIKNAKTDKEKIKAKEESDRNRRRSTFFCVGYSKILGQTNPPHHQRVEERFWVGLVESVNVIPQIHQLEGNLPR